MEMKTFFQKHADTAVILSAVVAAALWVQSGLHRLELEFLAMQKEMAIIKTVLIMKNIMPTELASGEKK